MENHADGQPWSIPFRAVNTNEVNTDISAGSEQAVPDRSHLKVGDTVGFRDRQNQEKYGRVIGLSQKTATTQTSNHERWRVAYKFLFRVIEGEGAGT